jgi:hypothetical protein
MSDLKTDLTNHKLSGVLESLDQEDLTPEEAKKALQDRIEEFAIPSFEYEDTVDFTNDDAIQADMLIARKMILDAMDKSYKLNNIVFDALMVDSTNPLFLQLAQSTTSTIQSTVKTLADLHGAFHKIVGQKKRNDILVPPEAPLPDEKGQFQFGSGHKLAGEEK